MLDFKQQTAEEKYGIPEDFLEVEVVNPKVQNEFTSQKYVDYEIICRVLLLA
jgi:sorting nexin-3/12